MYKISKFLLDYSLGIILLLFSSVILVPCMVILALTGEHKVWYRQKRIGYKNRPFMIIKFATMMKNSSKMGTGSLTLRNDPRVLPFGKFLRQTKINELPQIFNVFNGTMSMVGPRPQMEIDFYRFPDDVQKEIYDRKPGITGIGSIIFRDEQKYLSQDGVDPIEFYIQKIAPYKGALELWYKKHASFWVDCKLIIITGIAIIKPNTQLPFRCFKSLPAKPDWMD